MLHLPATQSLLHADTNKPSQADSRRIAHGRCSQAELAVFLGHFLANGGESTDVHQAAKQTFPEHDGENEPDSRDEWVHGVRGEANKIEDLQDRRCVQRADADEGQRRAGDENTELVDCAVCWVEGSEVRERSGLEGEKECWRHSLVDGIFSHVDEEEG